MVHWKLRDVCSCMFDLMKSRVKLRIGWRGWALPLIGLLFFSPLPGALATEPSTKQWQEQVLATSGMPVKDLICLGWADLTQPSSSISFRIPQHTDDCLGHPTDLDTPHPALFVSWWNGNVKYVEALTYDGATLKPIWQAKLSGPGFQAINRIDIGPEKTNTLLDIVIHVTSLPHESEMPSMPGPPQELRFKFDGTVYK